MEALRAPFDIAVAVEHVENAIVAVEPLVLSLEFFVDLVVGGVVKGVDLRLGDGWAGQTNIVASAEGDDGVVM